MSHRELREAPRPPRGRAPVPGGRASGERRGVGRLFSPWRCRRPVRCWEGAGFPRENFWKVPRLGPCPSTATRLWEHGWLSPRLWVRCRSRRCEGSGGETRRVSLSCVLTPSVGTALVIRRWNVGWSWFDNASLPCVGKKRLFRKKSVGAFLQEGKDERVGLFSSLCWPAALVLSCEHQQQCSSTYPVII